MPKPAAAPPSRPHRSFATESARDIEGGGAPQSAPMTYQAALKYLYDRVDVERIHASRVPCDAFKLDRMRALLQLLGNPHEAVKCIHVAGTKGKGSTCEMTASCLEACGYTVGIYTSPHLVDIRERIRISRRLISHTDFAATTQRAAAAAASLHADLGEPTFFELMTAMCFQYFADQAVDLAVIECGLGGRLDSTNVITPLVSAVTSISLDHTQLLGSTVELIAKEKAGIFKPGVPAVTVQHTPSVTAVFRKQAEAVGTTLQVIGEDIDFSLRHDAGTGRPRQGSGAGSPVTRISFFTRRCSYEHIPVPLKGEHQGQNCGLALAILDKLAERGIRITESRVLEGLERVQLAGRMEMVCESPRILLDGAHNPESIRCLMASIGSHIGYDSVVVVFGCASDKDVRGILEQVSLGADKVIFTRAAGNARAADPKELSRIYNNDINGRGSQHTDTLIDALRLASRAVGRNDLICVTGSFYLVGEAKKVLKDLQAKK